MTMQANTATLAAGARLPFDAVPADAAPVARTPSHRPVFVSLDGRRARVVRAVATAVAAAMALWIVALGVGLLGIGALPELPRVSLAPGFRTTGASAPDGLVTPRVDRGVAASTAMLVTPRRSHAGPEQSGRFALRETSGTRPVTDRPGVRRNASAGGPPNAGPPASSSVMHAHGSSTVAPTATSRGPTSAHRPVTPASTRATPPPPAPTTAGTSEALRRRSGRGGAGAHIATSVEHPAQ